MIAKMSDNDYCLDRYNNSIYGISFPGLLNGYETLGAGGFAAPRSLTMDESASQLICNPTLILFLSLYSGRR